jgi:hypothetical protein
MKKISLVVALLFIFISTSIFLACNKQQTSIQENSLSSTIKKTRSLDEREITIEMTPADYEEIKMFPERGTALTETSPDHYSVVNNGGGPVTGNCVDQMTSLRRAQKQYAANSCCCIVNDCAQGSNCIFYLYAFKPNSKLCTTNWPPFTAQTIIKLKP